MMEEPKISIKECLKKEKQIVVDPLSLKGSSIKHGFFDTATDLYPPPLQPPNTKFLSLSLPNSANSSPHRASNLTSKHHHDLIQEINLGKSKSCGEGRSRAPSDEFDLWSSSKPIATVEHDDNMNQENFSRIRAINESPEGGKDLQTPEDEGFKCSALCLFLPGFGKAKMVKARKEGSEMELGVISRRVSLEKFECGSWASSALFHEVERGDSMNSSFYDLPMELIKCSVNDVHAPVKSAFVFEKDLKGVLKNSSTTRVSARKSEASPRHVRFSTSSSTSHHASPPSCITPNIRKTRENFNAFLEAQSA